MSNNLTPAGKALIDAVKNQIRDNDPPETKQAYFRLLGDGIPEKEVYVYLARSLAQELFFMMKEKKLFNIKRYTKALSELPDDK